MYLVNLLYISSEQFDVLQDGSVILQSALDFETTQSYNLVISAEDTGFPPLSGTANLLINLLDVNDNFPEFFGAQTDFSIAEVNMYYSVFKSSQLCSYYHSIFRSVLFFKRLIFCGSDQVHYNETIFRGSSMMIIYLQGHNFQRLAVLMKTMLKNKLGPQKSSYQLIYVVINVNS